MREQFLAALLPLVTHSRESLALHGAQNARAIVPSGLASDLREQLQQLQVCFHGT